MKQVEVAAAIIKQKGSILAAQKGYGEFINMWEFPGGKMEPGETREDTLIRELKEEMAITVFPSKHLITIQYDYPNFHLILHCCLCEVIEGTISLLEHKNIQWVDKEHIESVNWLPANIQLIDFLKSTVLS